MNPAKIAITVVIGCCLALTLNSFFYALVKLYRTRPVANFQTKSDPEPRTDSFAFGSKSQTISTQFQFAQDPATQNDLGGVSHVSPNTSIQWRSEYIPGSEGASVAAVLAAARDRMSFLQTTPQASDKNARALFDLQKAIDTLDGRSDLTDSILGPK